MAQAHGTSKRTGILC